MKTLYMLADRPRTYVELQLTIRRQSPRILPEAVARVVCALREAGFIECRAVRWQIRRQSPFSTMDA